MEQSSEQITDDGWDQYRTKPQLKRNLELKVDYKRLSCRYGHGCTHIHDPLHLERFSHPEIPVISADAVRTNFMCYECGVMFLSLPDLQFHLQRKTAWSNQSLIGCRISCLIDNKEWHEGTVTHYHKSGKHSVEFRSLGEKRWIAMTKFAFYILEQPLPLRSPTPGGEYKETDENLPYSNCGEGEDWTFIEDLSLDFAFAQSVLYKVYGSSIQETGHKTRGHTSLTDTDRENAKSQHGSLLYGELLPRGVNKALGPQHLHASVHSSLFDLGMGTGKVVVQAFLQFRNLKFVYGIELSSGRFRIAEEALLNLVELLGRDSFEINHNPGVTLVITEKSSGSSTAAGPGRTLKIECGNMLLIDNIHEADIIMMETDLPAEIHQETCELLSKMHEEAMVLTYHDMKKIWISTATTPPCCLQQLEINKNLTDRFPTSWSVQRGHHFYLWKKCVEQKSASDISPDPQHSQNECLSVDNLSGEMHHSPQNGCFPLFAILGRFLFRRRKRDVDKVIPLNESIHSEKQQSMSNSHSNSNLLLPKDQLTNQIFSK